MNGSANTLAKFASNGSNRLDKLWATPDRLLSVLQSSSQNQKPGTRN
jgi:hypothetical protein